MKCKMAKSMDSIAFLVGAHFLFCISSLTALHSEVKNDLCHRVDCRNITVNKSKVFIDCKAGHMNGRCCYEENYKVITGIDLSHCNLMDVDVIKEDHGKTAGYNYTELKVLILDGNPFTDYEENTFDEMLKLEYLALPTSCSCPGGEGAWGSETGGGNATVCTGLVDLCKMEMNDTCPTNSHCVMHAPGVTWCMCDDGFYGYKCLRTGSFNIPAFLGGTVGGTAALSAMLWVVFRRKTHLL